MLKPASRHKIHVFLRSLLTDPGRLFLVAVSVFGLLSLIIMPPFMVPDENAHLYRAYQISEGGIFSQTQGGITGGYLPKEIRSGIADIYKHQLDEEFKDQPFDLGYYFTHRIDTSDREFTQFDTTAVYSPVSYLPQAIGIGLARLVFPSELVLLYVGRLFNLIAFAAMVYAAIRIMPVKKYLLVVAALLPMAIQQAASLSSDVMTIGLAFIAVATCLRLYIQKTVTKKQLVLVCVIAALLGLTKQTNVLLTIPFFFLPLRLFKDRSRRRRFWAALATSGFGAAGLWYGLLKLLHYNMNYNGQSTVDMAGQIHFLMAHPIHYVGVLFRTFIYNTSSLPPSPDFYLQSVVGVFSWISYQLPLISVMAAYAAMAVVLLVRDKRDTPVKATRTFRAVLISTIILSVLAVGSLLYLVWTPVGAPVIAGIQGRYFIPLIPLAALLFTGKTVELKTYRPYVVAAVVILVSTANVTVYLFQTVRYFS